jgi:phage gp16-like protein
MMADTRNAELALIHIARKDLALDEAAYRALVSRMSAGRTESSGDLTDAERRQMIEHFRSCGFKRKPGAERGRGGDRRDQSYKLRALWRSLYELGVARSPDDTALAGFVARHTGIDALRWNNASDLRLAIECLKAWCERVGYKSASSRMAGPCAGRYEPALIRAQWERLIKLGAMKQGIHASLPTWLHNEGWAVSDPGFLAVADAEEAVKRLGKWLRRVARGQPDAEGGDAG